MKMRSFSDRNRDDKEARCERGLTPHVVESTYLRADAAADAAALLASSAAPTAIFAHNDQAALGVLDALAALGRQPGVDVSVVGYDNSSISSAPGTALTTVDIHAHELGAHAARLAVERMDNPEVAATTAMSAPTLVVRGSTAPLV